MPAFPNTPMTQDIPPGGPADLAFVTSTPLTVSGGSGTYVGIRELARCLGDRRVRIATYAPSFWSPSFTLKRLLFNLRVAPRLRAGRHDWVVGFDLDGFHYGRRPTAPYVASIKGVIADELRNERGLVRPMLAIQAAFERLAVRRAEVVVATSAYSRDRIVGGLRRFPDEGGGGPGADRPSRLGGHRGAGGRDGMTSPPAILTVAHLYPRKNLGVLLQAYARLRAARRARSRVGSWEKGRAGARGSGCERSAPLRRSRRVPGHHLAAGAGGSVPTGGRLLPAEPAGGVRDRLPGGHGPRPSPIVAARAAAVPEIVADGEVGILVDPDEPRGVCAGAGDLCWRIASWGGAWGRRAGGGWSRIAPIAWRPDLPGSGPSGPERTTPGRRSDADSAPGGAGSRSAAVGEAGGRGEGTG